MPNAQTYQVVAGKLLAGQTIPRVHSPMGIELQAETPEEIAVSILAEVMMVKAKATGKPMKA